MMDKVLGFVFLALAVWQFAVTWWHFRSLRVAGDANTSPFAMLSLWYSAAFGVLMLGAASMMFF